MYIVAMVLQTTGQRLTLVRVSRVLTQEEFGNLVGLKEVDVNKLEEQDVVLPVDFTIRLKYRFPEVELRWLQDGD